MSNPSVKDRTEDRVRQEAESMKDKARDMVNEGKEKVKETASRASDAANSATEKVGSGMQTAGEKVEEYGPHGKVLGKATSTVADSLKKGGEYLESQGLSGIADDMTDMIRRNPIPAMLIGLGVGYLIARATRS